ncbi:hypothetical protein KL86DES1_20333 [uncultured Desulfovibrio sp.]|uniref:Uncharacterized protein n=1 Tax=uncultured Desulfovibrio sp. TaxID=167968 RepID=A0A212L3B6_9BACT|nr:hypothetical protein KL86DES1_20333 [uncultured Desulfovibrio sp.]VZH33235.1 conserved protein of unknown function [Desulfovibrio sp. 86]
MQIARCLKGAVSNIPASESETNRVLNPTLIRVLGGGGVGEGTLLQKGPSPTKFFQPPASRAFNT